MSDIILSSSVRQNLLSLQSTADLLSTTQNRLATGKKVNTALDNPTNFFTAQSLDNRASDINNLLDGIGNGVQVLQAANTGITSLQKLVDTAKSIANQVLQSPTGYTTRSTVTSTAALGGTSANLVDGTTIKSGDVLAIAASAGQPAFSFTFGASTSLAQLNTSLAASNLTASLDSSNKLVITTTNDAASSTIGAVTFTNTGGGTATFSAAGTAPVADQASQSARAALVTQYNNTIAQITTTAQDASFNGINLLNGDSLKLTFNETGKSTLSITGVTFNASGLGLKALTAGTDFLDNNSANSVIASLSSASSSLRSEASTLGSNLSIVQIRQDFSKNLINVLQTGSSNLTLADTNEEAANSQALSTRQSIAVSALALANQSQQSVLQLLR
ncbi:MULTISPECIES: flagellin N-terminal helical domain-containing protein [Bradyrhizobium]|uniref:flagellin N-terminal helical domain-containing protein n=1 Tax=Bradyrhizobium TaxID=374 RepID=UPI000555C853|nr:MULTISPECIES: flagellin [Bradyrhizobium]MCS3450896.1 flagellin-like hook-associated protein FlgL [Bradyrhizobium elkanii]MCS3557959.1 flagellin-like hook-associated protein FlgL [Bradyrhizobium elkanii]MCW2152194.1 flagellin-like hook-associated protein FlgL [Bradyrhizobium elkanii]MCW2357930.1 flagellin-like hook-associated protein FlgL [Bradyrhizobium elkanii]MCW2375925.1 flagellin-like hook-associated protein FlgL [Bradyrhizobium elkanii]